MPPPTYNPWANPGYSENNANDPLADPQPGYAAGFATSVLSGIPELFGGQPTETAQAFRDQYPISGVVSQLISPVPEYAGAYRISQIPALADRLEHATGAVLGRFGLNAAEAPIRAGMVREAIRFAPLEAARLAIGGTMYGAFDNTNFIDSPLFADVGLSTVLTGGLGGVGGWLHSRGTRIGAGTPHIEGEDLRLNPTTQFDMLLDGRDVAGVGEGDTAAAGTTDYRNALRQEILTETPSRGSLSTRTLPYIQGVDGASNAEDVHAINSLFEPSSREPSSRGGLQTQFLAEGPTDDPRTMTEGEQAHVAQDLGVSNIDDVLRNTIYPRLQRAQGPNGARALNNILSRPGWQSSGDGGFYAQETGGSYVVAKRLTTGNGRLYGAVRSGDRWLVSKTTRPGFFFPEADALTNVNMSQWARWRQMFQPGFHDDMFNRANDTFEQMVTMQDFQDLSKMNRRDGILEMTRRLAARATDTVAPGLRGAIRDSESLRALATEIYDKVKPTEFLRRDDPMYNRLFSTLRNSVAVSDRLVERIIRGKAVVEGTPLLNRNKSFVSGFNGHEPIAQAIAGLTDHEANLIAHINDVGRGGPEAAAKELLASGDLSENGARVLTMLQSVNRDFLHDAILPALKDLPQTADTKWLEGYVAPRLYTGDNFMEVRDGAGNLKFLASGKSRLQAQRQAQVVIDTAKENGKDWRMGDRRHLLDFGEGDFDKLQAKLVQSLQRDDADNDVLFKAMRRLAAQRASTGRNPAIPGSTTSLRTRSSLRGSPDVQVVTRKDLLDAIDGHMRTLSRYAAVQSWRNRYGDLLESWGKTNPTLYNNLVGKTRTFMGISGNVTQTLNRALAPILGPKGATKIAAATNEVMYAWNLGLLNTSFAILNALTPLQTVTPELAFLTRAPAHEIQRIYDVVPVFDHQGNARGLGNALSPLRLLGEAHALAAKPTAELSAMYGRMIDDNGFTAQLYENFGPNGHAIQTMREAFQQEGYLGFLRKGARFMAEKSEEFSRIVAFNSGYLVGKGHFGLEGDQLYRFAKKLTDVTMFQYGTVDRARAITGPVGSVFGLFKNWQMHFMGNMLNYAGLGIRTGTWSPLLWNMAAAGALGGLGATPLKMAADGLARWYGDAPSAYQWMQRHWPGSADEIYYGAPAFLGISLQASATMPGTDVRNDLSQLSSIVLVERMKAIGKALGNAWTVQTATGQNALRDPNVRDQLIGAFAPRFMIRAAATTEGDYIRSMSTGYPEAQHVSPATRMLYGLGFNPIEIERMQTVSRELMVDQTERRDRIDGLGQAYAQAMLSQDSASMGQIMHRAMAMGLPLRSVLESAQTRFHRETTSDLLSRYSRQDAGQARADIAAQEAAGGQ